MGTAPAGSRYRHDAVRKIRAADQFNSGDMTMNSIIYIVGLIVVVLFILSFLGLR